MKQKRLEISDTQMKEIVDELVWTPVDMTSKSTAPPIVGHRVRPIRVRQFWQDGKPQYRISVSGQMVLLSNERMLNFAIGLAVDDYKRRLTPMGRAIYPDVPGLTRTQQAH